MSPIFLIFDLLFLFVPLAGSLIESLTGHYPLLVPLLHHYSIVMIMLLVDYQQQHFYYHLYCGYTLSGAYVSLDDMHMFSRMHI